MTQIFEAEFLFLDSLRHLENSSLPFSIRHSPDEPQFRAKFYPLGPPRQLRTVFRDLLPRSSKRRHLNWLAWAPLTGAAASHFPDPHPGTSFADTAQANCPCPLAPMCAENLPKFGEGTGFFVGGLHRATCCVRFR